MATLLQVRNLTTHFFTSSGTVRAVDNITFYVAEGETVAVVGESGCGQSGSDCLFYTVDPVHDSLCLNLLSTLFG